jgi:hypothetical protein
MNYEGFRRSVITYLSAGHYTDKEKIVFTLSYMTKGFANNWAKMQHTPQSPPWTLLLKLNNLLLELLLKR